MTEGAGQKDHKDQTEYEDQTDYKDHTEYKDQTGEGGQDSTLNQGGNSIMRAAGIAGAVVAAVLLIGTAFMGYSARKETEEAVHSVSNFFLDELAGRREQVVANNLQTTIRNHRIAIGLMEPEDLSDSTHLRAYQSRMKKLYDLEKFAFVDEDGTIYTSTGTQTDIDSYSFDYRNITGPEISVKDLKSKNKKVVIALPAGDLPFQGKTLKVGFMEIDMERMLDGVSMRSEADAATFCNLYTRDGDSLTNMVLGGVVAEEDLMSAFRRAEFDKGYSLESFEEQFSRGEEGSVSFTYNGIQETLAYVPVSGTDWMLTYLIRENVISDRISSISRRIMTRSVMQTLLTALVLLGVYAVMFLQNRKSARLALEKETMEAANRVKRQELEQRIALQEQLLQKEQQRQELDNMITAMASDYRSVYYVNLDTDQGICYRTDGSLAGGVAAGDYFPYRKSFTAYAENYVDEKFREGFLQFIDPERIQEGLERETILSYRYLVNKGGKETYEMIRAAGVRHAEGQGGEHSRITEVGMGFSNVDEETRKSMAQNQALNDALTAAEDASKAKTVFLSNMSHEIRTPMNAIIGLDNIALNEPGLPDRTREHLVKIGISAHHLLNLINDILDMSRIESGQMTIKNEEFSFLRLIEQVNTLFSGQCQEKGIDYQCRFLNHLEDYYIGDNMKLRQVLINIISNAVKFTPEGGHVTLTAEQTGAFDGKAALRFTIKDTGVGISKDYLPRIFDAFSQEDSSSTNKYGSSGLGLAITKNIVEMMNGKIEVESEKGVGTTFTVTVTLMTADRSAAERDQEIDPKAMNVLVVDDDSIALEHAKLVLEKAGIGADTALSGAEAVELVRLRQARRDPYNLILLDWKMPEMDGVESARRIREMIGNDTAIIILTAYKWDEIAEEASEAGVDSFITKPLFLSSVMEEFRKASRKKGLHTVKEIKKAELKGRKILLAEDVDVNAEIMMMVLSMREMEAERAVNGREAVEMFAGHPEGYYDAVLMDMRMTEMDGLTATMKIRAMDRPDASVIPIIALTANAFDEDVQRSLQAGLNAHLSKPVEPENLFATLESLIYESEEKAGQVRNEEQ